MTGLLLSDAFAHHVWATLRLIDTCLGLSPEQLASPVPGTFGSILETMRHLVAADSGYLFMLTGERVPLVDADRMALTELRVQMEGHGGHWSSLLEGDLDPARVLKRVREDGSETHAPVSIRLAQAVHHGTDHRSQICTALSNLGIAPPDIDVWDFGRQDGRVIEIPPRS